MSIIYRALRTLQIAREQPATVPAPGERPPASRIHLVRVNRYLLSPVGFTLVIAVAAALAGGLLFGWQWMQEQTADIGTAPQPPGSAPQAAAAAAPAHETTGPTLAATGEGTLETGPPGMAVQVDAPPAPARDLMAPPPPPLSLESVRIGSGVAGPPATAPASAVGAEPQLTPEGNPAAQTSPPSAGQLSFEPPAGPAPHAGTSGTAENLGPKPQAASPEGLTYLPPVQPALPAEPTSTTGNAPEKAIARPAPAPAAALPVAEGGSAAGSSPASAPAGGVILSGEPPAARQAPGAPAFRAAASADLTARALTPAPARNSGTPTQHVVRNTPSPGEAAAPDAITLKVRRQSQAATLAARLSRSMQTGDRAQVERNLKTLAALKGAGNPYVLKLRAYWAMRNSQYPAAEKLLNMVLENNAGDVEAGINLVVVEVDTGREQEARRRLGRLAEDHPDDSRVRELRERLRLR